MSKFVVVLNKYKKFLPVAVAAVASALVGAFHPGMHTADWANVVVLAAGALSVLVAPNVPGYKYVKETLAAITAVATLVVSGVLGGFDANSVIQVILAVAAAFGVTGLKNIGDYYHLVTNPVAPVVTPVAPATTTPAGPTA